MRKTLFASLLVAATALFVFTGSAFSAPTVVRGAASSQTVSRYGCPAQDKAGFRLDYSNLTTDPIHCSYPVFAGENPNDFYCTYSATTGVLVQDHDANLCPSNGVPLDSDLALAKPSDVTVDAASPAGAVVNYTNPTASDEDLSTVTVNCSPASGTTFAIGDTTVTCTATDTDGDTNSPVQQTFNVHVESAAEQLSDLANAVIGVGPGTSLADKVAAAQADLAAGDTTDACGTMNAFVNEVKAQSGKSIPPATASTLIAAAQQIEAVIGCKP